MVYSPAVGFTKISILLLVLRIFCPGKRDPFYWLLQGLNILNTLFYAAYFCIPFVLCQPRKKIWLPQTPGKCLQLFDLYISSAAFNIVSDIAMYSAPLWKIWHLQMSQSKKLGMSAVFATGGLWVSADSERVHLLIGLISAIAFAISRLIWATLLLFNQDFSYVKLQGTTFALAELACGIICSCLFVLPRLYRHLTAAPPHNSEEYRLRKWKKLALSSRAGLDTAQLREVHHKEEKRNPWENDIEVAAVLPKPFHQGKTKQDKWWSTSLRIRGASAKLLSRIENTTIKTVSSIHNESS